jgi:predicted transcriptional regulator
MCQDKIIQYLIKVKRPVEINELCKVIGVTRQNVSRACGQMAKYKEIKVQRIKSRGGIKFLFSC